MNPVCKRYTRVCQAFLSPVGLWPLEDTYFATARKMVSLFFVITGSLLRFWPLGRLELDVDVLSALFSCIAIGELFTVKFIGFSINQKTVVQLIEGYHADWEGLSSVEIKIFERQANYGIWRVILSASLVYMVMLGFWMSPLLPILFDIFMPLNESRSMRTLPLMEYYFDSYTNRFLLFKLWMDVCALLGVTVTVGTDALFIMFVYHLYGFFRATRYHLNRAFEENLFNESLSKHDMSYRRIKRAVQLHLRSIQFLKKTMTAFAQSYFALLCVGMVSTIVNLHFFSQKITKMDYNHGIVINFLIVVGHYLYIFEGNVLGQRVINYSSDIFYSTYDNFWYNAHPSKQKLLIPIMQNSARVCVLKCGGLIVASLEEYTRLVKLSMSYVTFLCSIR